MEKQPKKLKGRYLYAVANGREEAEYGPIGIEGKNVFSFTNGSLSAVVSRVPDHRIRPQRRNLAAHQLVLKTLIAHTTPLPMTFGIIADGSTAVRKILSDNEASFEEALQRVSGKLEMGLRVTWDVPNIFEYFVKNNPKLRAVRDRFFTTDRKASQEEKIEIGRLFDCLMTEERETHTQKVLEVLDDHCFEIKTNKCTKEADIMNLACLVGRDTQKEYEDAVFVAANHFDNNFAFDYNGPWAPHNFVEIDLSL